MKTKTCYKCKKEKRISEFHKNKCMKDGYHGYCKLCRSYKSLKTTNNEKYKHNLFIKGLKKCSSCYKIKELNRFNKNFYRKYGYDVYCKNCKSLKYKNRRKNNHIYYIKKEYKYRKDNKEKLSNYRYTYMKKYSKSRYDNDLDYKLLAILRARLVAAIKGKNKSKSTIELLGCSIDFLKIYLESKFKDDMTWDNYGRGHGKWVIDHIRPCASFDLCDSRQQKDCFHYTNLQPLWWEENAIKGCKL